MWMVINSYKAPGSWQCRVFQSVTDTSIRQLCVLRNISICVTRLYFRHVLKMWAWSHHECPVTSCVMWRHVVLTWRASTSLAGMQGLPLRSSITLSPLDNQLLNVNPSNNAAETIPVILLFDLFYLVSSSTGCIRSRQRKLLFWRLFKIWWALLSGRKWNFPPCGWKRISHRRASPVFGCSLVPVVCSHDRIHSLEETLPPPGHDGCLCTLSCPNTTVFFLLHMILCV